MELDIFRGLLAVNDFKGALEQIRKHPNIAFIQNFHGESALHFVAMNLGRMQSPAPQAMVDGCRALINALIAGNANCNAVDKAGNTPLMVACRCLHFPAIASLMAMTDVVRKNHVRQGANQLLRVAHQASMLSIAQQVKRLEDSAGLLKDSKAQSAAGMLARANALSCLKLNAQHALQQYQIHAVLLYISEIQQDRCKRPHHDVGIKDPRIENIDNLCFQLEYYRKHLPENGRYDRDHMHAWLVKNANREASQVAVADEKKPEMLPSLPVNVVQSVQMFAQANSSYFRNNKAQRDLQSVSAFLKTKLG